MSSSLTGWMIALTVSLCAIILSAAANLPLLHMTASGIVSLGFALMAVREHSALAAAGASKNALGSSTARHIGLVWAWGALGLLVTYLLILEERWPEWWQFFMGFAFAAVASLVFSNMLDRDDAAGKVDDSVMKVGRGLVLLQLAGVLIALISLFVDGKFPRAVTYADWAGCNIFFFGALAIAAISANALFATRKT